MPEVTKQTVTVYSNPTVGIHPASAARHLKFCEMINAGKSNGRNQAIHQSRCNGVNETVVSMTVYKYWRDQAAAEEWRDFLIKLDQEYNQGLMSTVIQDI